MRAVARALIRSDSAGVFSAHTRFITFYGEGTSVASNDVHWSVLLDYNFSAWLGVTSVCSQLQTSSWAVYQSVYETVFPQFSQRDLVWTRSYYKSFVSRFKIESTQGIFELQFVRDIILGITKHNCPTLT